MTNLKLKKGWLNRHINTLPHKKCNIKIIHNGKTHLCKWLPKNNEEHLFPAKGFLGTAKVIAGDYKGLLISAYWNQDDYFIYYSFEFNLFDRIKMFFS